MAAPLLTTKLYVPSHRPELVPRPRLFERLNEGITRKLILIYAPAGFGKITLGARLVIKSGESRDDSLSIIVQKTEIKS